MSTNPLLAIWTRPRATIREQVANGSTRDVLILTCLGGIASSLDNTVGRDPGRDLRLAQQPGQRGGVLLAEADLVVQEVQQVGAGRAGLGLQAVREAVVQGEVVVERAGLVVGGGANDAATCWPTICCSTAAT